MARIRESSERLQDACRYIQRTWSGSFAGWHGRMYFRDFQVPTIYERFSGEWGGIHGIPEGWGEKEAEEVRAKVDELVGSEFSVERFEKEVEALRKEAEQLRDEMMVIFSSFTFGPGTEKEKSLLEELEKFEFGTTKEVFIRDHLPKTIMTRDTGAMQEGMCIAA